MGKSKRCVYSLCSNSNGNHEDKVFFVTLPRPKKELQKCKRWVAACGRYDSDLLSRLEKSTLYICSLHFVGENGPTNEHPDPITFKETTDTLKLMALKCPTQPIIGTKEMFNFKGIIPIEPAQPTTNFCSEENIIETESTLMEIQTESTLMEIQIEDVFNLDSLKTAVISSQISLPNIWSFTTSENNFVLFKCNVETSSILISLTVSEDSLKPVVKIYGQTLPISHPLLTQLPEFTSVEAIHAAANIFKHWSLCEGIKDAIYRTQFEARDFNKNDGHVSFFTNNVHSIKCGNILKNLKRPKTICGQCSNFKKRMQSQITRKQKSKSKEKRNKYLSRAALQKNLKTMKCRNENLAKKMKRLQRKFLGELKKSGQDMSDIDTEYLKYILKINKDSFPKDSFPSLFAEQQLTALKSKNKCNRRWHPKIIQWCLYMKQKSPAAYDILLTSDAFQLPSKRTLYNYASHIGATPGFCPEIFKELREILETSCKEDHQQYFSLMFDEIKIKEDIVYKANTGELIGYIHLNEVGNEIEEIRIEKGIEAHVATHTLQVMIRSITGKIKYTVGYFPCHNMSSDCLHSIITESISKLEMNGIKILSVVFDGATTNRKVMKQFVGENGFKWKNIYAMDEERYLYFICDPPHLMKTARNCFSNSDSHAKSRYLWKNGHHILWSQLVALFEKDYNRTIKLMPKITNDHIKLNSFLRMRVRLATQIFSSTVANAFEEEFGDKFPETVSFIRLMDKFFDLMITRNLDEGMHKRNMNLNVYRSVDDPRLQWLEKDFENYFLNWEEEVANKPDFTATQRNMMKLSRETIEGLLTTARSVPEVVRFLLRKEAKFVLTNRLNQDCLEQEFGKQRRSFGNNDAPNVYQFGLGVDKIKKIDFLIKAPETGCTLVQKID